MGKLKNVMKAAGFIGACMGAGAAGFGVQKYVNERSDLPDDLLAYFADNKNSKVDLEVYQAKKTQELCDNVHELIYELGDAAGFNPVLHRSLSAVFHSRSFSVREVGYIDNVCEIRANDDYLSITGDSLRNMGDVFAPNVIKDILETLTHNLRAEDKMRIRKYRQDNPEASLRLGF